MGATHQLHVLTPLFHWSYILGVPWHYFIPGLVVCSTAILIQPAVDWAHSIRYTCTRDLTTILKCTDAYFLVHNNYQKTLHSVIVLYSAHHSKL